MKAGCCAPMESGCEGGGIGGCTRPNRGGASDSGGIGCCFCGGIGKTKRNESLPVTYTPQISVNTQGPSLPYCFLFAAPCGDDDTYR